MWGPGAPRRLLALVSCMTGPGRLTVASAWTAELYEDSKGASPIEKWMDSLGAPEFAALNAAITHVLEPRGLTLVGTEWMKTLRGGLYELRIRHTAKEIIQSFGAEGIDVPSHPPSKILLRVFVNFHGAKVILLLAGYDKGKDPSEKLQQKEIANARKLLTAWKLEQAKVKKKHR